MKIMKNIPYRQQRGMALVLSLLILLVMVVLGVAAMSNVNMQERMAGNANQQALAFEAASAGVSNSINFAKLDAFAGFECGTTIVDPDADVIIWGPTCWSDPESGECLNLEAGDNGAFVRQRMYCLKHPETSRSQLFVLNRGEVRSGNETVAQRDIEVRLDIGSDVTTGAHDCAAMCMPGGNPDQFNMASSGSFTVDGGITVGSADLLAALEAAVAEQPNGNYLPLDNPFQMEENMPSPWNDPMQIFLFTEALREIAQLNGVLGCSTCYYPGDFSHNGSIDFGTEASPQITYVNGDLDLGGSPEGHGILVVNGDLAWNGTSQFYGLVIVLGESVTVTGGGNGGVEGSFVMAPVGESGGASFGDVSLGFHGRGNGNGAGGGNQLYKHDCDQLGVAQGLLQQINPLIPNPNLDIWNPSCDTGVENIFLVGPEELVITSWRENIGWREAFFGSD